jgi:hypothetical protein
MGWLIAAKYPTVYEDYLLKAAIEAGLKLMLRALNHKIGSLKYATTQTQ